MEEPTGAPSHAKPKRGTAIALHVVSLATLCLFLARIPLLARRYIDPDEFEHAHSAWCVFKGMLPYKDFFEHHTPWYHYFLSPFFRWFEVDLSFASARHFLILGRWLSSVLAVLSVLLVISIGRLLQERRVGLLAGLFLAGQHVFLQKTLELRPDVLALPFLLAGLWFTLRGLDGVDDSPRRSLRHFLAGGLGTGAAIMCTQKMLFVLPGAFVGLGIWTLMARGRFGGRTRFLLAAAFVAGLALPGLLTWAAFALRHGGDEFITNNFLLNSQWKYVIHQQLLKVLETSWPILILCLLGITVTLYRFVRSPPRRYGDIALTSILVGLIVGIPIIPVAHRQYYLIMMPILCLFAATGLVFLVDLAKPRMRPRLLLLALIPLSVLPVVDLCTTFTSRNDDQLARLRYVFDHTRPTDLVMDGWEGTGVFRPHAFHYFFLHEESLVMLPRQQVDAFVDALEAGRIRPRLIALDTILISLGSRFVRFVYRNYTSRDGFFFLSKAGLDGDTPRANPHELPASLGSSPWRNASATLSYREARAGNLRPRNCWGRQP